MSYFSLATVRPPVTVNSLSSGFWQLDTISTMPYKVPLHGLSGISPGISSTPKVCTGSVRNIFLNHARGHSIESICSGGKSNYPHYTDNVLVLRGISSTHQTQGTEYGTYGDWISDSALDHRYMIHLLPSSPCVGNQLFVVIGKSVLHSRNGLPQKFPIGPVISRFRYK